VAESNGANVAVVLGDDATSPGNVQFKILKLPDKTVEKAPVVQRGIPLESVCEYLA
jgi:hypothetical protein